MFTTGFACEYQGWPVAACCTFSRNWSASGPLIAATVICHTCCTRAFHQQYFATNNIDKTRRQTFCWLHLQLKSSKYTISINQSLIFANIQEQHIMLMTAHACTHPAYCNVDWTPRKMSAKALKLKSQWRQNKTEILSDVTRQWRSRGPVWRHTKLGDQVVLDLAGPCTQSMVCRCVRPAVASKKTTRSRRSSCSDPERES